MIATLKTQYRWLTHAAGAAFLGGWLAGPVLAQVPPQRTAALPSAAPLPSTAPPPALPSTAPATLQTHQIVGADVSALARHLESTFTGRPDLKLMGEPQSGKLFVAGGPQVQQEIERYLIEQKLVAAATPVAAAPAPAAPTAPAAPPRLVTQSWQLKNLNWHDFEKNLTRTWGTRLESSQNSAGDMATYRFPARANGATSFVVDHRNNLVTITSPAGSARSWLRMAQIIDARPQAGDEMTSVAPLDKSDPQTVWRAISLLRGAGQSRPAATARRSARNTSGSLSRCCSSRKPAEPSLDSSQRRGFSQRRAFSLRPGFNCPAVKAAYPTSCRSRPAPTKAGRWRPWLAWRATCGSKFWTTW